MTFTYSRGQKSLSGITPGYHMSMHAKNHVPRPSRLAVIEKCHVCDGQTDKQTDRQIDRQTENRHKLSLSLTFIDMTHNNILTLISVDFWNQIFENSREYGNFENYVPPPT